MIDFNSTKQMISKFLIQLPFQGDSGGPLIWNFQGRWYIAGIVSFGMQCGTATSAGVYTRVDRFVQWISSETEQTACLAPAVVLTTIPYPWLLTRSTSAGTSSGPDATSFIRAGKQDKELETTFK